MCYRLLPRETSEEISIKLFNYHGVNKARFTVIFIQLLETTDYVTYYVSI